MRFGKALVYFLAGAGMIWLGLRMANPRAGEEAAPVGKSLDRAAQKVQAADKADIGKPAELPTGWPLYFLSLPPGSCYAPLNPEANPLKDRGGPTCSLNGVPFNRESSDSGRLYGVGLHLQGGFQALRSHVEKQLVPLGYSDHWHSEWPDGSLGREYISEDRMFVVQIFYWAQTGDCHLEVFAYDSGDQHSKKALT